jgi:hypothetical protein
MKEGEEVDVGMEFVGVTTSCKWIVRGFINT